MDWHSIFVVAAGAVASIAGAYIGVRLAFWLEYRKRKEGKA